jgi:cellulose synthase/poly-beta-1,6-N-acetylglucosamine synthase-like glycosyltransferase
MIATLYAIAVAVLVVYGLNQLWLTFGFVKHDRREDEKQASDPDLPDFLPIVTIQLPIYNERFVVERLIDACAVIDYESKRLEIQILDDSTDDTCDIVAERVRYWSGRGLNMVHVRRDQRIGFKAGALQHGLSTARGEFVAIFDADFVPPSDFLRSTLPQFRDPQVGMVQTRWVFLNRDRSLLTRLQALSLEAHFAVEQFSRNKLGCFINFNGTGGVWRRSCIDDAGGWQGDTLTEDLDLSYRAQLKGWRFAFLRGAESPSELPIGMNALRTQQFRWTKGSIQTAKKTVRNLLLNGPSVRETVQGLIHLTSHVVFPFLLLAGILHAPLFYIKGTASGPGDWYFALMTIGVVALSGVFLVQLFAQRWLYSNWLARMILFPLFLAGSMGFSINNTMAVVDGLSGRNSQFMRTPKQSNPVDGKRPKWWENPYANTRMPRVVWLEVAMTLYCAAGLAVVITIGEWTAVPFQAFLMLGFGLVSIFNLVQVADAS